MFPHPYAPRDLCSPVLYLSTPMFPRPKFPSTYIPHSIGSPYLWSALCSPAPIFPGSYVPRSYITRYLCSPVLSSPVHIFPGSYVPRTSLVLCSLGPMFPSTYVPPEIIPLVLYSPVPMFPGSYVPRVLCSPDALFGEYSIHIYWIFYGRHWHIRYERVTTMYGGLALNERLNEPYIVGTSEYIWYFTFTHNVFYTLNMTLK